MSRPAHPGPNSRDSGRPPPPLNHPRLLLLRAQVLDKAKRGVVFVDEAYQLDPTGPAGAAGQNVLDRLMDHMSRHALTSTVIFAGYEAQVRLVRGG